MNKKKKKTTRSGIKYASIDPLYNPKIRREYIDIDYFDQLSDEKNIKLPNGEMISEKEYINKFFGEFTGANLDFKNLENNLHNTPDLKKDCTDRNNSQNRCEYGIAKASGLVSDDPRHENDVNVINERHAEDVLIDLLDKKRELENSD